MKSPGAVYKKLKDVKYFHFVNLYKKYTRITPENCKFNFTYVIKNGKIKKEIGLCLLHQPKTDLTSGVFPHLIDICEELHHVNSCNGFILKYNKEEIKKIFEEELSNRAIKEKKYPDICALEWVLERSVVGIPILSWIQKIFYAIKRIKIKYYKGDL